MMVQPDQGVIDSLPDIAGAADGDAATIAALLDGFSVETTSGEAERIGRYSDFLRPRTPVYIAHPAGTDFGLVVDVARKLRDEGLDPVPHFVARFISGRNELETNIARATSEAGVEDVLVIAGGQSRPIGEYSSSIELLETGNFDSHGIQRIGLAGHPEGNRDIGARRLRQAILDKNAFAARTDAKLRLVTQFGFDPAAIVDWDKRIRAEGNSLPIHIGVAGLATAKTLIRYARFCGVGPSLRAFSRNASSLAKLTTVSTPDALLAALARYKATEPECGIERVHFFPFGGIPRTSAWVYAAADGRVVMRPGGEGFEVERAVSA